MNRSEVYQQINVAAPVPTAFQKFVHELDRWWPREYTWSQEGLQRIVIHPEVEGFCTEIGPHGFRCDWGRVTELVENETMGFTWQISPKREPVPDPTKASQVTVGFQAASNGTLLTLAHYHFNRHGAGADDYRDSMGGEYGWAYILGKYRAYCEQ